MRIAVLAAVLIVAPRPGHADLDDRRDEIRRCLEATAAAASNEDLDAYIACFDPRLRGQIRKTVGLRFAQFDVGVAIEDVHLLSGDDSTCDVAVRYTTHLSRRSFDFLSVLTMKHVDDTWKIRKETIRACRESTESESPFPYGNSSDSREPVRASCSSGSCSLTGR